MAELLPVLSRPRGWRESFFGMKLSVGQRFKALFTGRVDVQSPERVIERIPPNVMGSWNGYTLSLWQGCNKHIEWMQGMMADHYFRDMLAVLTNATPSFKQESLDPTSASVALGKFLGMRDSLAIIYMLARYPEASRPEVEADYNANDEEFVTYQEE